MCELNTRCLQNNAHSSLEIQELIFLQSSDTLGQMSIFFAAKATTVSDRVSNAERTGWPKKVNHY